VGGEETFDVGLPVLESGTELEALERRGYQRKFGGELRAVKRTN
jgi:hypothetical protein